MKSYTDQVLHAIDQNTSELYKKLASVKPNDDLSLDDIGNIMYYLKAFGNLVRHELCMRSVQELNAKKPEKDA